ncbi:nucleoside triphosphate hydrolase [Pseudovibrio japonicus]|nr:nucleoside triphosphate hydrolase [Pseudovibrio japonicus]
MLSNTQRITQDQLVKQLASYPPGRRHLVAVVGPPGSGKSTLAEALAAAINETSPDCAAVFPMDGIHFDDAILEERGLCQRKGAPETFDVAGFCHLLDRLRRNQEAEIAVPVFDRDLEISRNAARIIPHSVELLIVEGNYLLLDRPFWRDIAAFFDLTVMLDVSAVELRRRLYARWRGYGVEDAEATRRVEENDLPNGLIVLNQSRSADLTLREEDCAVTN